VHVWRFVIIGELIIHAGIILAISVLAINYVLVLILWKSSWRHVLNLLRQILSGWRVLEVGIGGLRRGVGLKLVVRSLSYRLAMKVRWSDLLSSMPLCVEDFLGHGCTVVRLLIQIRVSMPIFVRGLPKGDCATVCRLIWILSSDHVRDPERARCVILRLLHGLGIRLDVLPVTSAGSWLATNVLFPGGGATAFLCPPAILSASKKHHGY